MNFFRENNLLARLKGFESDDLANMTLHGSSSVSASRTTNQIDRSPESGTVELIQADLRNLSNETRKRFGPIKEAAESAILKIKTLTSLNAKLKESPLAPLRKHCQIVLQPFLMGCDTKNAEIILLCLTSIQRLITHKILNEGASGNIVSILWQLMEYNIEEVRLLQTSMLLLTTTDYVQGPTLSKCLVLCFRLHQSTDHQVIHTASAILRQSICQVFDRIVVPTPPANTLLFSQENVSDKVDELEPFCLDGWRLFQDLCNFSAGDNAQWLTGLNQARVQKSFCLEMIESLLEHYSSLFVNIPQFNFLLKEKVCNIVIKLFSPGCKYQDETLLPSIDFVLTTRVLRLVSVLLESYNSQLKMESEIFLTLLIKFCEADKLAWQRAIAVEVLHKICWRPKQLRNICRQYDLEVESHGSTPVFEQLIDALSSLTSRLFYQIHRKGDTDDSPPENECLDDLSIKKLPLNSETYGGTKYYYLDVLINSNYEIPFVSEDYVLRMAIATQIDIMAAIIDLGDKELIKKRAKKDLPCNTQNNDEVTLKQMISSSWSGLLQTLCLLFESAPDESTVSSVLDTIIALTAVAGGLNMDGPREALVGSLCRFALPPGYHERSGSSSTDDQTSNQPSQGQVLVMGQPLSPTTSGPGFVLLTTRNIQVLKALLQVALDYGPLLGQAWSSLLNALQHLSWILGFKPNLGSSEMFTSAKESANGSSTVLTTAITTEMPKITEQLFRVFEKSKELDEVALHHLINALCEQSAETMDLAYGSSTREPSLFAVAKLIHVAKSNLSRLEILWKPVTGHLLEVCQHTNIHFRKWGSDGLSSLIVAAIQNDSDDSDESRKTDRRRIDMVLNTFKQMSSIPRIDVRTRQMKCVLEVLETCGDDLGDAWPILLDILQTSCDSLKDQAEAESARLTDSFLDKSDPNKKEAKDQKAENQEREVLVKSGFKAIQLVVTDFLGAIPVDYLEHQIESTMRFGSQQQSLNISLTSIGLLWNIIDFLCHDLNEKIKQNRIQNLWLCLYSSIGQLCVDGRPEIRKSAGQTLFGTISAHGQSLQQETWRQLFWDVLFPLLENVENEIKMADKSKSSDSKNFLVHHSRDTKEKQWAETKRLTLNGLAKLFKENKSGLSPTEWLRCWKSMLEYIEKAAYCDNEEISTGAMDSLQELLESQPVSDAETLALASKAAWHVWINICDKMLLKYEGSQNSALVPKQDFLCQWSKLLPFFVDKMKSNLSTDDLSDAANLFERSLLVPVTNDSLPFLFTGTGDELNLTILQREITQNIQSLHKFSTSQQEHSVYPVIFEVYLSILKMCQSPPEFKKMNARFVADGKKTRWVIPNYLKLGAHILNSIRELYQKIACDKSVIKSSVLTRIISTMSPFWTIEKSENDLWIMAHSIFINILNTGLPVVRQFSDSSDFDHLWAPLEAAYKDFLFNISPEHQTTELHIELSCKTVLLIKNQILNYRASYPVSFIQSMIEIIQTGQDQNSRGEFSRQCFEIGSGLTSDSDVKTESDELQDIIRLIDNIRNGQAEPSQELSIVSRTLQLIRLIKTQREEANITELAFLLQACRAILQSIIKEKKSSDGIMVKLYELYPLLCNLITFCPENLMEPISHALLAYHPFLSKE